MPAIEREIEEAIEEGIEIEFLAAPQRASSASDDGRIVQDSVQRMELGEPDESGRRRPVPIEGDMYDMDADTVIMAVSQQPDWSALGAIQTEGSWLGVGRVGPHERRGRLVRRRHPPPGPGHDLDRPGPQGRGVHPRHAAGDRSPQPATKPHGRSGPDQAGLLRRRVRRHERRVLAAGGAPGTAHGRGRPGHHPGGRARGDRPLLQLRQVLRLRALLDVLPEQRASRRCPRPAPRATTTQIDLKLCDGCKKCWPECPCGYLDMV